MAGVRKALVVATYTYADGGLRRLAAPEHDADSFATVKDWLSRRTAGHKIRLTIEGDTLELDSASPAERTELIDTFIRRHQPA